MVITNDILSFEHGWPMYQEGENNRMIIEVKSYFRRKSFFATWAHTQLTVTVRYAVFTRMSSFVHTYTVLSFYALLALLKIKLTSFVGLTFAEIFVSSVVKSFYLNTFHLEIDATRVISSKRLKGIARVWIMQLCTHVFCFSYGNVEALPCEG